MQGSLPMRRASLQFSLQQYLRSASMYPQPSGAVLVSFFNIRESSQSPSVTTGATMQPLMVSRVCVWLCAAPTGHPWHFPSTHTCCACRRTCQPVVSPEMPFQTYVPAARLGGLSEVSSHSVTDRTWEVCAKSPAFCAFPCHN